MSTRYPIGSVLSSLAFVLVGASAPSEASGQATGEAVPTYVDVAPILQQNCETCHRVGSIAPMSLTSYQDARRWASQIRRKVTSREMPPWHLDETIGIQDFKNDISLSDEEIATITRWVDGGTPMGDPARLPPPLTWGRFDSEWEYEEHFGRPPDLVISSPTYRVPANELDHWPELTVDVPVGTARWVRGVEVRPADPETRYVFHHANPSVRQASGNFGIGQASAGTVGYIFPDDTGQLLEPDAQLTWSMHLFPIDRDVDATLQLGLWLYPEGESPEFVTPGEVIFEASQSTGFGFESQASSPALVTEARGSGGGNLGVSTEPQMPRQADLLIPPNSVVSYRGVYVLDRPARIYSIRGHMHLRGKYQIIEAIYPDGRWEVLNKLNWDHRWQTAFLYEDHAMPLLPKGTVLMITNVFDNTANNPRNPAPDQWAVRGDRTIDEMSHTRIGINYFNNEEDFQRLVREREALLAARRGTPVADAAR
ncbi:MAG: cytochrome c [Gemmatimonadetes bacterium]|nr:cytochrome c [Gemmatimonadota bacterium]